MTLETIATKLKEELSQEQLEQFINDLKHTPDVFLNELSERENSTTAKFIQNIAELVIQMDAEFKAHQSLLQTVTKNTHKLNSFGERLLNLSLGEIKFIMLSLEKTDPEHTLNRFFINYFRYKMSPDKFESIVEDERFENFI